MRGHTLGSIAFLISVLLLLAPATPGARPSRPEVLTNASIVEMARAKLSADVIVAHIRSSPGNYALSTQDLIKLKRQGIADEVIAAMQQRAQAANDAHPDRRPQAAPRDEAPRDDPPDRWVTTKVVDGITSRSGIMARRVQRYHQGDEALSVSVTARCSLSPAPQVSLWYRVQSDRTRVRRLKWIQPVVFEDFWGTWYEGGRSRPWMEIRVRGGNAVDLVHVEQEYEDQVALVLRSDGLRTNPQVVELPLEDGTQVQVQWSPLDAGFLDFLTKCFWLEASRVEALSTPQQEALSPWLGPFAAVALQSPLARTFTDPANFSAPVPRSADGFLYGDARTRQIRKFTGGLDQLEAELVKRIEWHGVVRWLYGKELQYVVDAAARCASISELAAEAPLRRRGERQKVEVEDLPQSHQACAQPAQRVSLRSKTGAPEDHRGLWMSVEPVGGSLWRNAKSLRLLVGFDRFNDTDTWPLSDEEDFLDAYEVIDAVIPVSAAAGRPPRSAPAVASDGFRPGALTQGARAPGQPEEWRRTTASTRARLEYAIERAGLSARDYQAELDDLEEAVRRCGDLRFELARMSKLRRVKDHPDQQVEDLSWMKGRFDACAQPPARRDLTALHPELERKHRHLWMRIQLPGLLWRDAREFRVTAGFLPLEGDPLTGPEDEGYQLVENVISKVR